MAQAHTQPTAASRSFLMRRWVIEMSLPEARVTGADPAYAFSARESGTVVTDLGKNPCAGQVRQAGETGDDGVVGVLAEFFGGRLF